MSQVYYDVSLIPQNTSDTCWWAAARMIVEFHRGRQRQTTIAGGAVGQPGETLNIESANRRLPFVRFEDFARIANLSVTYLSPTARGLIQLLNQKGPLMYGGVVNGYRGFYGSGHAVVITGCLINGSGAQVAINDPWQVGVGARLYEPYDEFFRNISAAAPFIHI